MSRRGRAIVVADGKVELGGQASVKYNSTGEYVLQKKWNLSKKAVCRVKALISTIHITDFWRNQPCRRCR